MQKTFLREMPRLCSSVDIKRKYLSHTRQTVMIVCNNSISLKNHLLCFHNFSDVKKNIFNGPFLKTKWFIFINCVACMYRPRIHFQCRLKFCRYLYLDTMYRYFLIHKFTNSSFVLELFFICLENFQIIWIRHSLANLFSTLTAF